MKGRAVRGVSAIVIISLIGFILFIHQTSLKPSFSVLKDNSLSNLRTDDILYYGSSSCEVCQEFDKVLKDFQDETRSKIYYWDATDLTIVRKAADIKVYNTPTIIIKRNNKVKILQGYHSKNELKQFMKGAE